MQSQLVARWDQTWGKLSIPRHYPKPIFLDNSQNKDDAKKFADLIGPTDPKLDAIVRDKLVGARINLLLNCSFFGNMATRLKLVNADEWCPTAATDGRNFYYNSRFIQLLRPGEICFLFGHEVLHVCYDHFGRRGDRDPQIFNIANDLCVNADLKKHKVGEFITSVPCLYDAKYENLSSEEIYDDLLKNAEKIDINKLLDQLIDEHMDGDDESSGSGSDKEGEGKGRPKLSKEEREKIRNEIKEAMITAAQTSDAGSIPAGVKRMIKELTEPKMDWRELIQQQIHSTVKNDFTFATPSRKGWHVDAIVPGVKKEDAINVFLMLDMSGSISDEQGRDFITEVYGLMTQFSDYRIHIACFDTAVYGYRVYTSDDGEDIREYELAGGGGTDFECMFQFLKDNEIEPDKLIVFTDGYPCGSWGDPNYCDTVWVIHGQKNPNPPFGTWTVYDKAA